MAGNNNFTEPQTFQEAWRRQEKRQQRQERRTPGAAGAVVSNEGLVERVFQGSQQEQLSSAFALPPSDWAIETQSGISHPQSYGALVQWSMVIRRIGPPLTVGVTGNITNNTVATLTAGWVPIVQQGAHTSSTGRVATFVIGINGLVQISAVDSGGGDIATDEGFALTAFYIATNAVA